MAVVTFGGLASGLDTNAIISGLVNAERQPLKLLEQKQAQAKSQLNIVESISAKLQAVQTKAEALDTLQEATLLKAAVSDDDTVAATATSEASPGSYALTEVALAVAQKNRSASFAARTDALAQGTFVIRQDGVDHAITLDATNATVEGLVAEINAKADLDVTASLFYDGAGYRILLTADQTGTGAAFTVDETGLSGGALPALGTSIQAAGNATFKLDGQLVTSQSNTVTGMLPGLTLDLKKALPTGSVTLTVSADGEALAAKVKELVTAYNDAVTAISAQLTYTGAGKPASPSSLFGDSTLRAVQRELGTLVTDPVAGQPTGFETFAQVGVSLGRDGKLTLDEAKLREAAGKSSTDVARLLAGSGAVPGLAKRLAAQIERWVEDDGGALNAKKDGLRSRIDDLGSRITSMERRLDDYETSLRKQFTALERQMAQLQAQGNYLAQQLR